MQLKNVKPVPLSETLLSKARNRVYRVGIELEGGWLALPEGTEPTHDGSVRGLNAVDPKRGPIPLKCGELPSPPIAVETIPTWMKRFYPSHVNETCGLHVHMSFKTALTYQRLMVPAYPATIIAEFRKWAEKEGLKGGLTGSTGEHPIWPRLRGESEFCQHVFFADQQALKASKDYDRHRNGHRYSVINYCYSAHSTVECRLLPMMESCDAGIRAVKHVIAVTNAFLVATAAKEEHLKSAVVVDDECLYDERHETV